LDETVIAILRWPALRRAVAVVCAVAFLVVGFAHSLHHFDAAPASHSYQTASSPSDTSPETSKKPSLAVEHCHGCVMVAMEIAVQSAASMLSPDRPAVGLDGIHPYPPVAETPPPIASI
jgi:hypothetical protein